MNSQPKSHSVEDIIEHRQYLKRMLALHREFPNHAIDMSAVDIQLQSEILYWKLYLNAIPVTPERAVNKEVNNLRRVLAQRDFNVDVDDAEIVKTAANVIAEDGTILAHQKSKIERLTAKVEWLTADVQAAKAESDRLAWAEMGAKAEGLLKILRPPKCEKDHGCVCTTFPDCPCGSNPTFSSVQPPRAAVCPWPNRTNCYCGKS